jgi:hypothetical protein
MFSPFQGGFFHSPRGAGAAGAGSEAAKGGKPPLLLTPKPTGAYGGNRRCPTGDNRRWHWIRAVRPDGTEAAASALTPHAARGVMTGTPRPAMTQTPEVAPVYVSVVHEFPEDLYEAMRAFVRSHPSWDHYRLMQVALAGFLFQQGSRERAVARHYLDGLFDRAGAGPQPGAVVVSAVLKTAASPAGSATVRRTPPSPERVAGAIPGHAANSPRSDRPGAGDGASGRLSPRPEVTLAPPPRPAARVAMPTPPPQGEPAASPSPTHRQGNTLPPGRGR